MSGGSFVPQKRRLLKAVAITLALAVAVPLFCKVAERAKESRTTSDNPTPASYEFSGGIQFAGSLEELEKTLEDSLGIDALSMPEAFEEEVGFPARARDIRSSGQGVVGYIVDGDVSEVFSQLESDLSGKGWSSVELGGIEGATFVKSSGSLTWMLATCMQVGDATSVVMRCA